MALPVNTIVNVTQPGYDMRGKVHRVYKLMNTNPETGENYDTPEGQEPDIYVLRRDTDTITTVVIVASNTLTDIIVTEPDPIGFDAVYVEEYIPPT